MIQNSHQLQQPKQRLQQEERFWHPDIYSESTPVSTKNIPVLLQKGFNSTLRTGALNFTGEEGSYHAHHQLQLNGSFVSSQTLQHQHQQQQQTGPSSMLKPAKKGSSKIINIAAKNRNQSANVGSGKGSSHHQAQQRESSNNSDKVNTSLMKLKSRNRCNENLNVCSNAVVAAAAAGNGGSKSSGKVNGATTVTQLNPIPTSYSSQQYQQVNTLGKSRQGQVQQQPFTQTTQQTTNNSSMMLLDKNVAKVCWNTGLETQQNLQLKRLIADDPNLLEKQQVQSKMTSSNAVTTIIASGLSYLEDKRHYDDKPGCKEWAKAIRANEPQSCQHQMQKDRAMFLNSFHQGPPPKTSNSQIGTPKMHKFKQKANALRKQKGEAMPQPTQNLKFNDEYYGQNLQMESSFTMSPQEIKKTQQAISSKVQQFTGQQNCREGNFSAIPSQEQQQQSSFVIISGDKNMKNRSIDQDEHFPAEMSTTINCTAASHQQIPEPPNEETESNQISPKYLKAIINAAGATVAGHNLGYKVKTSKQQQLDHINSYGQILQQQLVPGNKMTKNLSSNNRRKADDVSTASPSNHNQQYSSCNKSFQCATQNITMVSKSNGRCGSNGSGPRQSSQQQSTKHKRQKSGSSGPQQNSTFRVGIPEYEIQKIDASMIISATNGAGGSKGHGQKKFIFGNASSSSQARQKNSSTAHKNLHGGNTSGGVKPSTRTSRSNSIKKESKAKTLNNSYLDSNSQFHQVPSQENNFAQTQKGTFLSNLGCITEFEDQQEGFSQTMNFKPLLSGIEVFYPRPQAAVQGPNATMEVDDSVLAPQLESASFQQRNQQQSHQPREFTNCETFNIKEPSIQKPCDVYQIDLRAEARGNPTNAIEIESMKQELKNKDEQIENLKERLLHLEEKLNGMQREDERDKSQKRIKDAIVNLEQTLKQNQALNSNLLVAFQKLEEIRMQSSSVQSSQQSERNPSGNNGGGDRRVPHHHQNHQSSKLQSLDIDDIESLITIADGDDFIMMRKSIKTPVFEDLAKCGDEDDLKILAQGDDLMSDGQQDNSCLLMLEKEWQEQQRKRLVEDGIGSGQGTTLLLDQTNQNNIVFFLDEDGVLLEDDDIQYAAQGSKEKFLHTQKIESKNKEPVVDPQLRKKKKDIMALNQQWADNQETRVGEVECPIVLHPGTEEVDKKGTAVAGVRTTSGHQRTGSFSRTLSKKNLLAKIRNAMGKQLLDVNRAAAGAEPGQQKKAPKRYIVKRSSERNATSQIQQQQHQNQKITLINNKKVGGVAAACCQSNEGEDAIQTQDIIIQVNQKDKIAQHQKTQIKKERDLSQKLRQAIFKLNLKVQQQTQQQQLPKQQKYSLIE